MTGCHLGVESEPIETAEVVNELDVAYKAIPEAERESWLERAQRALSDEGVAEYMQILPTVMERALTLWVGATIPVAVASG